MLGSRVQVIISDGRASGNQMRLCVEVYVGHDKELKNDSRCRRVAQQT